MLDSVNRENQQIQHGSVCEKSFINSILVEANEISISLTEPCYTTTESRSSSISVLLLYHKQRNMHITATHGAGNQLLHHGSIWKDLWVPYNGTNAENNKPHYHSL